MIDWLWALVILLFILVCFLIFYPFPVAVFMWRLFLDSLRIRSQMRGLRDQIDKIALSLETIRNMMDQEPDDDEWFKLSHEFGDLQNEFDNLKDQYEDLQKRLDALPDFGR